MLLRRSHSVKGEKNIFKVYCNSLWQISQWRYEENAGRTQRMVELIYSTNKSWKGFVGIPSLNWYLQMNRGFSRDGE